MAPSTSWYLTPAGVLYRDVERVIYTLTYKHVSRCSHLQGPESPTSSQMSFVVSCKFAIKMYREFCVSLSQIIARKNVPRSGEKSRPVLWNNTILRSMQMMLMLIDWKWFFILVSTLHKINTYISIVHEILRPSSAISFTELELYWIMNPIPIIYRSFYTQYSY